MPSLKDQSLTSWWRMSRMMENIRSMKVLVMLLLLKMPPFIALHVATPSSSLNELRRYNKMEFNILLASTLRIA